VKSPLKDNWSFGVISCPNLQDRSVSQKVNKICLLPVSVRFLAWLILRPWRRRPDAPPKHRMTFTGLQVVNGFFNWPNPSSRTMALVSTQSLTEMNSGNIPGG
jgi:hypothetical protein